MMPFCCGPPSASTPESRSCRVDNHQRVRQQLSECHTALIRGGGVHAPYRVLKRAASNGKSRGPAPEQTRRIRIICLAVDNPFTAIFVHVSRHSLAIKCQHLQSSVSASTEQPVLLGPRLLGAFRCTNRSSSDLRRRSASRCRSDSSA